MVCSDLWFMQQLMWSASIISDLVLAPFQRSAYSSTVSDWSLRQTSLRWQQSRISPQSGFMLKRLLDVQNVVTKSILCCCCRCRWRERRTGGHGEAAIFAIIPNFSVCAALEGRPLYLMRFEPNHTWKERERVLIVYSNKIHTVSLCGIVLHVGHTCHS